MLFIQKYDLLLNTAYFMYLCSYRRLCIIRIMNSTIKILVNKQCEQSLYYVEHFLNSKRCNLAHSYSFIGTEK
jgi:hypothetical protein